MENLDESIELELKKSEIEKNKAETEKYLADKKQIDLETKNLKYTFYIKPIIAGLALCLGGIWLKDKSDLYH
jgi:hypothetical protein